MHTMRKTAQALVAAGICIVILILGGIIYHMHNTKVTTVSATYCNTQGDICLSYPKTWKVTTDSGTTTLMDNATGIGVLYSPTSSVSSVPCTAGNCVFTGLSTIISSGFSNGDDVAGVFQDKQLGTYTPEYFLIATPQLILDGLKVGSAIDLKQTLEPTFINTVKASAVQTLKVISNPQRTFNSTASSQAWLASAGAQTAEAVINSARKN